MEEKQTQVVLMINAVAAADTTLRREKVLAFLIF
jgi:hypothetical protein